jgi:hypothetical protein
MKITIRPPCRIVDPQSASIDEEIAHLHVQLWLALHFEDWDVLRSAHVHFLRPLDGDSRSEEWRRVDLTSHPLQRVASEEIRPVPAWAEHEVREWVDDLDLEFFRSSELGLVSDIWESEDEFRHRLRGMLRPAVRRQIEELNAISPFRIPGRRTADLAAQQKSKERLAEGMSTLVGDLEKRRVHGLARFTRGVEIGMLLVPPDFRPPNRPRRERMINAPDPERESR